MEVPAPESRNMNGNSQISPEGRPDVAPVDSPLTGCYLLIIVAEPHIPEHKDIILQKIAKGILSWDKEQHLVDLEKELEVISSKAAEGEVSRFGERLIQYASENLVTEVLINPTSSTVLQCTRNLLSSFTRHRHIVHAGYTYTSSGSWILQDGTFSYADMCDAFQDAEVQRVLQAYENVVSINIHCSPEGDWMKLPKEPFVRACKLRMNPTDVLTAGSSFITNFINYISPYVVPITNEELLESSDVVGNIRFSHPTLYVFPGGQGDSALFGINGFNMLVDGGFGRKACFWDFTRHLDRLDAILVTRINNNNIHGISSVLQKKKQTQVYPQIGHFFCNLQDRKSIPSPSEDKDKDPLLIDLVDASQKLLTCLHHINLKPQPCFRDNEPINLYHKVGHGTLDMYVLSPAKDSKEVKDFIQKWYANDNKLFTTKKDAKEFNFPLQNLISICALLVWQPANPTENITRLLFPGSAPQHKIFEGLDKLKHLEFLKHSICTAKTISPSKSISSFMKPKSNKVFDKISYADSKKEVKPLKEKSPPPIDNKQKVEEEKIKPIDNKIRLAAPKPKPAVKAIKSNVRKSESVESDEIKGEDKKKDTDSETESKKLEDEKKTAKVEHKSKIDKPATRGRSQTKPEKSLDRKPKGIMDSKVDVKSSPTTPKKSIEAKVNGVTKETKPTKPISKSSPSATPAKSAKDANNRKMIESKYKTAKKEPTKPEKADKEPKPERKPISRRPKVASPMRKPAASPVKALRAVKTEKDAVIRRPKATKPETTDSSPATSPCVEETQKLVNDTKLTDVDLDLIKAQELADLKEEQEVIKEIEAVFNKDDKNKLKGDIIEDSDTTGQEEVEEYLIIEKEEYPVETVDTDETKKLLKDSAESEKAKIDEEEEEEVVEKVDEAPIEAVTLETEDRKSVPALTAECREKIEEDVDLIIKSATDLVKSKASGVEELKEKVEEFSKEISTTSPEDKLELSSEKKTTDTKDVDDVENKEVEPNVAESQPDEKFSATSGATTAPTLPEDERITLDEIKEDKINQGVEEKYVKEETKEKELPISIEPTRFEPKPKQGTMEEIQFNAQQAHLRDVVKTPDEVADLPMHEEADMEYDDLVCDKPKTLEEKKTEEVLEAKEKETKEDVKVPEEVKEVEVVETEAKVDIEIKKEIEETKEVETKDVEAVKEQSKSPSVEKDETKVTTEDIEATKEPSVEKDITKTVTEDIEATKEPSKSPSVEKDGEKLEEVTNIVKEPSKSPSDDKVEDKSEEESKIIVPENIEIVKEPSKSPSIEEEDVIATKEQSKSPTPELVEDVIKEEIKVETKEKPNEEIKEKLEDTKEPETKQELVKETKEDISVTKGSKSPTPEKEEKVEVDAKEIDREILKENLKETEDFDSTIPLKESYIGEPLQESDSILPSTDKVEESKISSIISEAISDIYETKEQPIDQEETKVDGVAVNSDPHFDGSFESFEFKGYTTELRETHITTLDSPVQANLSLEHTLDSKVKESIHEEPEDELKVDEGETKEGTKVVTLLKDSVEFLESTSKMIEGIKQGVKTEVLESSPTKSSEIPRGIDVEKLVVNVAVVLKSDKSLEEIASTFVEGKDENKDVDEEDDVGTVRRMLVTASSEDGGHEIEICASGTIDYSTINEKAEPKPDVTETVKDLKNILNDVCIKSSIISFLEEERKSSSTESLHETSEKSTDEKEPSKSPASEKTGDLEKVEDLEKTIEKSKSPSPELDVKDIDAKDISQEKEQVKHEEASVSKSPTPDKSVEKLPVDKDLEKVVEESTKSKSPTPDKSESEITPDTLSTPIKDFNVEVETKITSKSPSPELQIEAEIKKESKSPTPEKDLVEEAIKETVREKSKSPTPEADLVQTERKDSVKADSKSPTPEKDAVEEVRKETVSEKVVEKSPSPEKDLTEAEREDSIKEISKSPIPDKDLTEVSEKETIEEKVLEASESPSLKTDLVETERKESIKEPSKSPIPEKDLVEEVASEKSPEKSKSPTPERILIETERKDSIKESSKSPVPEKDLTEGMTYEKISEKSKSPTPEKDLVEDIQNELTDEKLLEKSKSPTPEKDLIEEARKESIKESSKSPTPEVDIVEEVKKDAIPETLEEKSKSPTPEKDVIKAETKDSVRESSKSPIDEIKTESKVDELQEEFKSSTPEKVETEKRDSIKETSKSPTPEKTVIEEVKHEAITEQVPEKSKSPTPEKDLTEPERKDSIKEPSKSPTPEKASIESERKDSITEPPKSPIPEVDFKEEVKKETDVEKEEEKREEKLQSPTPEKDLIKEEVKDLIHDIPKSPSPEKNLPEEARKESICDKFDAKSKSPSPIPEKVLDDDKKSKSPSPTPDKLEKEQSISPIPHVDEEIQSKSPEKVKAETTIDQTEKHEDIIVSNKSPSPEKMVEKSKSPSPDLQEEIAEKSKTPKEKEEAAKDILESQIDCKSSTPEKIDVELKEEKLEFESKAQEIEESSKSPVLSKEEVSSKVTTDASPEFAVDKKEHSKPPTPEIEESKSATPIPDDKALSKSPTPERLLLVATPESEIDQKDSLKSTVMEEERRQSDATLVGESPTLLDDHKEVTSKSPTPEKQITTEEDTKRKSPTPEKDDVTKSDETKEVSPKLEEIDTKSKSPSPDFKVEEKTKSPSPEKLDDKKSLSSEKLSEAKDIDEKLEEIQKGVPSKSPELPKDLAKSSIFEPEIPSTPEKLASQTISVEESPRKSITPDSLEHRDTPSPSQFLSQRLDEDRLTQSPSPIEDFSQESEKLPSRKASISGKLEKESTDNEKESKSTEVKDVTSKSPSPGPSVDTQKDDVEKQNLLIKDKDETCTKGKIEKDLEEPEKTSSEDFDSNIKDSHESKTLVLEEKIESSSSKMAMELTATEKPKSPSPEKFEEIKDKDDFNISPKERESLDDKVESKSPTPCPSKSPTPEDEDDFKMKKLNASQAPLTNGVHSTDSPTSDTDEDSQIRKHPETKTVVTKDVNVNEIQETLSKSSVVKEFSTESCDKDTSSLDTQKSQTKTQETDLPLCDKKLEEICDKQIHSTHEIDASKPSEIVATSSVSGTKHTDEREICVSPYHDKDQVPDISVDSPAKHISISDDQSDHSIEQNDSGLATERISPLLSGRSTPEIKIDLDVDLQDVEDSNLPGPSKSGDLVQGGSGKSTPDIAEIEKIKEISQEISGVSTPPTAPVSPVIKASEDFQKVTTSEGKYETISEVITQEIVSEKLTKTTIQEKVSKAEDKTVRLTEVVSDKLFEKSEEISSHTAVTSFGMSSDVEKPEILEGIKEQSEKVTIITKTQQDSMTKHVEVSEEEALHKLTFEAKGTVTIERKDAQDSELENILYKVVDDDVSSPPSNLSSGQISCAPIWDEHQTDEEEIPESPISLTSQLAGSPHFDPEELSLGAMRKTDAMSTSVYGTLSDEPFDSKTVSDPIPISSTSVETVSSHFRKESTLEKSYVEFEKDLGGMLNGSSSSHEEPKNDASKDPLAGWGKPLGLPSPAPPSDQSKTTPKKEKRVPASILAAKNKINSERKRSESPGKLGKKIVPVFLDLAYVPHNGNANYSYVDFFKRIRARYYVFSGIEPSREVYNALLEAKQTWEDKEQEVTIIPTYDTDVLGYWVAENEGLLTKNKIDLSPSASRCTINLQDHETSCSAYRLEF